LNNPITEKAEFDNLASRLFDAETGDEFVAGLQPTGDYLPTTF
jgi:hypothetical protein